MERILQTLSAEKIFSLGRKKKLSRQEKKLSRQRVKSEGALNVFVETVINKLSRMSLRKEEVEKFSICFS